MSQKVTIWIFFLLLVLMTHCEVTVTAANNSNSHSITFKAPTADNTKHIRMEFTFTLGESYPLNRASAALCGTHAIGDTLMTNNNTPGFFIMHYCSGGGSCDVGNGNDIVPEPSSSKS